MELQYHIHIWDWTGMGWDGMGCRWSFCMSCLGPILGWLDFEIGSWKLEGRTGRDGTRRDEMSWVELPCRVVSYRVGLYLVLLVQDRVDCQCRCR